MLNRWIMSKWMKLKYLLILHYLRLTLLMCLTVYLPFRGNKPNRWITSASILYILIKPMRQYFFKLVGEWLLQIYAYGTCHMASLFSPLSGTTTAAICSSSNLLVATFMQHLLFHPTSAPLLATSSPLPSSLIVTSHPDQKGLKPLLALLLVSIRDALLTTYAPLPSHLSVGSHHEHLKLSHTHQIILNSENF